MGGLRSLRLRLVAVLTGVVACAMGVVFLYVVPSLRQNLISERQARLEAIALSQQQALGLQNAFKSGVHIHKALQHAARIANGQATAYVVEGNRLVPFAATTPALPLSSPIVKAARRGDIAHGRTRGGAAVVAFPAPRGGIVMLSQSVADVYTTAAFVERRILIATGLALAVATVVGWGLAVAVSRRVGKLESASSRIAAGHFDQPIGDESPDELGRLARSFDMMQDRLAQVDRARKDFIANASHELRTPLFSLGGFLELLENEDLDDATREEFLLTMREQVRRLTKLASDLLDLSRLDAGAVEIEHESIDLTGTARTLVREFRGLAAKHGSRVTLTRDGDTPPRAVGDEQRVQQIGRVLVDNAIRHTPTGTEVRVGVSGENGRVRLSVVDDGPGIDDGARERLFQRFARGDHATAAGSGLGLAIARELAQRMDGSLEVESQPGRTEFTLALPVARESL
jgi:signal transduction histidine kinase